MVPLICISVKNDVKGITVSKHEHTKYLFA